MRSHHGDDGPVEISQPRRVEVGIDAARQSTGIRGYHLPTIGEGRTSATAAITGSPRRFGPRLGHESPRPAGASPDGN